MNAIIHRLWSFSAACAMANAPAAQEFSSPARTAQFAGQSDASALVAIDNRHFAVGDDENNVVHVYQLDGGNMPVYTLDLSVFLKVRKPSIEADIEGAARIGSRIYWITSHGRNASGKSVPNRHRFFATEIVYAGGVFSRLEPVGVPNRNLLEQLCASPQFQPLQLNKAAGLAPKEIGALNIEGLAATPEGAVLIGFRNPLIGGKALVAPLLNPDEVIQDEHAIFGKPLLLNLQGQGIRSMDYWNQQYYIIGGSFAEGGQSELFSWDGEGTTPRKLSMPLFWGMNPESIAVLPTPERPTLLSVSDDGNRMLNGVPQKKIKNMLLRNFRVGLAQLELSPNMPAGQHQKEDEVK